ncbi:MAG: HTH-type transcriptional regulator/antitoxin HigA, partial [Cryomorphaceae bacterium]
SKARVSEILSGKRPLTIPMARNLHQDLGIPASVLLADERAELPKEIDVSTYPVKEMHNYGWFPQYEGKTWQSVKCHAEDMLHSLLEPFKDSPVRAFNRAGFKEDAQLNESALYAWRCRVLTESEKQKLSEFDTEDLTEEFISSLVNITQFDDGPRMAIELLAQRGIAVVIMQHLPKTYLDGAALRNRKGNPVIGLTLRHDRLDNFWFTLFHELGHVKMHLEQNPDGFFDDTESNDNKKEEGEANSFALNHLIPHDQWGILRETIKKTAEIRKEAKRLAIHPAIIAGRLRNEFQSYSKFRTLIGQGEVRSLLLQ